MSEKTLLDEITEKADVDETTIRLEGRRMALISQVHDYLDELGWDKEKFEEKMNNRSLEELFAPDVSQITLETLVEIESVLGRKLFVFKRNVKFEDNK